MEILPPEIIVHHVVTLPSVFAKLSAVSTYYRDLLFANRPYYVKEWLERTKVFHPTYAATHTKSTLKSCTVYSSVWKVGKHKGRFHGEYKVVQNGIVIYACHYRSGVLHGKFITQSVFPDGRIYKTTGEYYRGKKVRTASTKLDGELIHQTFYTDGKAVCKKEISGKHVITKTQTPDGKIHMRQIGDRILFINERKGDTIYRTEYDRHGNPKKTRTSKYSPGFNDV
nr:hypothetical protein K-LCC10_0215 [Kaumoebavirus]